MADAAEILKRAEAKAKREKLELELRVQLVTRKLTVGMLREFRFHPDRKWRFDFAWPDLLLGVECEGITYDGGRHQRLAGYTADCEKYNAAALAGWVVLRYTAPMIKNGEAVDQIFDAINNRWRLSDRAAQMEVKN